MMWECKPVKIPPILYSKALNTSCAELNHTIVMVMVGEWRDEEPDNALWQSFDAIYAATFTCLSREHNVCALRSCSILGKISFTKCWSIFCASTSMRPTNSNRNGSGSDFDSYRIWQYLINYCTIMLFRAETNSYWFRHKFQRGLGKAKEERLAHMVEKWSKYAMS